MEQLLDDQFYTSSNRNHQKVEPGNLLEECWFFGNLLNTGCKSNMSRCNSDPSPSSNYEGQQDLFVTSEKSSSSTMKKHPKGENLVPPKLVRAPSLPSSMERAEEGTPEKERHDSGRSRTSKIGSSSPKSTLIRAPSLPPWIGREEQEEEEEDQESEFSMGRLIRQASLNSPDILPPKQTSKNSNMMKKHPKGDNFVSPKLVRAPSLPSFMAIAEEETQEKENHDLGVISKSKILSPSPKKTLIRAPSLPPWIGREEEEEEDQENEFSMGRLIRQASLNSPDIMPPRQTTKNSSIPRQNRQRKKVTEGGKEMGHQYHQLTKTMTRKTPSDKELIEDVKALSSKFEKGSLSIDVSNNVPAGLQEKGSGESNEEKGMMKKPYNLSDGSSWHVKSSAPTIPKWSGAAASDIDKRLAPDMKAQIKHWARAVASNARAPGPGVFITNQN